MFERCRILKCSKLAVRGRNWNKKYWRLRRRHSGNPDDSSPTTAQGLLSPNPAASVRQSPAGSLRKLEDPIQVQPTGRILVVRAQPPRSGRPGFGVESLIRCSKLAPLPLYEGHRDLFPTTQCPPCHPDMTTPVSTVPCPIPLPAVHIHIHATGVAGRRSLPLLVADLT